MNDKQRKRITIASILGVISIGVTSLSFSYAWYASSARVEIAGIDISVHDERNLVISPDRDGEYKSSLRYEELTDSGMFDPCSSMDSNLWIKEKKANPELYRYDMPFVDKDGRPSHSIATKGLFTQELYLKVDDDAYVTLDKEMFKISEDIEKNKVRAEQIAPRYPEYTVDEILTRLNNLKKCMRVSILVPDENDYRFYIIDPYKDENDVLLGGKLDLEKTGYYSYYVTDGKLYETVFGEINNRDKVVYDEPLDQDSELVGEETSFNARDKKGVYRYNQEKSLANGIEIAKEKSYSLDELDNVIIPMYHNIPKRIVLSFYMEGWDLDCTNAHMGASFGLELGFKILREM